MSLVDDGDYASLSQANWYAMKSHRGLWYAVTDLRHGVHLYMHEALCQKSDGMFIDHKDHDGLNNQRSNLRACTQSQNMANARKRGGTSSRFKVVSFDSARQKWRAQLTYEGLRYLRDRFETEIEAAIAYNDVATSVFGEFANLNYVS